MPKARQRGGRLERERRRVAAADERLGRAASGRRRHVADIRGRRIDLAASA
jgi:hypothetical protein